MSIRTFHTMTRRASLLAAGVSGPGALVSQFAAAKKSRSNKDKKLKKAKKACQQDLEACRELGANCADQVEECVTLVAATCGGGPVCLNISACCALLVDCDAAAFLDCFGAAG